MSQYPIKYYESHNPMNREVKYARNGVPANTPQSDPRVIREYSSHGSLRAMNRYPPSAQFQAQYSPQQRPPQHKQSVYARSGYPSTAGFSHGQKPYPAPHGYSQRPFEGYGDTSSYVHSAAASETLYKNPGILRGVTASTLNPQHKADAAPLPTGLPENEETDLMNSKKGEIEKLEDEGSISKKKRKGVRPCCCCPGCCSRKVCVIVTFLICILVGVVIWLLYPKVPSSSIETIQLSGTPQVNNEQLPYFFNATLMIRVSMNNYNLIPISLSKLEAVGYDSNTNSEIGRGIAENVSLPGQRVTSFEFPYVLTYFFGNVSDPTWIHLARSCVPTLVNFPDRSAMAVRFMASMWFPILSWTGWVPKVTYQGNFVCPEP
ncbi:hypothetical protein K7432_012593 [Basidiobolus ranarum]|uniref:Late embryogenesis abundant protein LEA-2 subgroup domain-containing protein n=1 Tax=Basidiobolus ranarum TaxID=34480 RepID=A0ABR2VS19_9FUNG